MRHLHSFYQYLRIFFIVNITTYTTYSAIMAPKKENTKKIAGNAKVRSRYPCRNDFMEADLQPPESRSRRTETSRSKRQNSATGRSGMVQGRKIKR